MSIATMSRKVHEMTPEDELIGSMTKERIALLVRYTGGQKFPEDGYAPARHWLAHMLDTEVPEREFDALCAAFSTAGMMEDADLELWFDLPNTEANRERMLAEAEETIVNTVEALTTALCIQLEVTA